MTKHVHIHCKRAVHALTSEDHLPSVRQARPLEETASRHFILRLGGCKIPESITHPSANRGGRGVTSLTEAMPHRRRHAAKDMTETCTKSRAFLADCVPCKSN